MGEILSSREFVFAAVLLWLGFSLLAFLNGLLRGFHRVQWLVISLFLGPVALVLGLFLRGRGPRVSLFGRERGPNASVSKKKPIGDLFQGKPLYSDEIRELKRNRRYDEAVDLLKLLVDAVEEKSRQSGKPAPAWYYEQLAVIYRRQGKSDAERAILERYRSLKQPDRARARKLAGRLERLKHPHGPDVPPRT